MFSSLTIRLWRSRGAEHHQRDDLEANNDQFTRLPSSGAQRCRPNQPKLQLNTGMISSPIQRSRHSITGLEGYETQSWHPSPISSTRSGPSNIAWLRHDPTQKGDEQQPARPPAARLGMVRHTAIPLSRSISSPASSQLQPHPARRLGMNPAHTGSTYSLRTLTPSSHVSTLYGDAYDYPLVKPLSPIAEQDYFSPESLRKTIQLPADTSTSISTSVPSPAGSQSARPSPVHSLPFITRPVNRSLSQSTHRSGRSTTSTVAPSLPPSYPSQEGDGSTPLRPGKTSGVLPTILAGSSEEYQIGNEATESSYGGEDEEMKEDKSEDTESLRSASFVTAGDTSPNQNSPPNVMVVDYGSSPTQLSLPAPVAQSKSHKIIPVEFTETDVSMIRSDGSSVQAYTRSPASASSSFIRRRWDKDAGYAAGSFTLNLKPKHHGFYADATPAFWAFWLGFFFPVLWFVGGWHFTNFGEQPERLTTWEFYFNGAYWRELFCCGRGKLRWHDDADVHGSEGLETRKDKGKERETPPKIRHPPPLPRWITEKLSTDVKKARLNDAKRSLRGISFGYPFVPKPVACSPSPNSNATQLSVGRIISILSRPNRFLDHFHGVRLRDVHGKPEGPRRMFDPWIQRCRYAFCYAMVLFLCGLATAATTLIILSLRNFR
ncbi:hypothetical protein GGU10DRAFT_368686 [Lentinula aff. detonsa]|uniref:Uncharacterized protein n=1 Tax=Lentinula aff. detonsa TaxID=2804958 RepID=A0AA38L2Y4_9AGAR|nr:hypothetical protein GGU10DRAFT_368686 [Lentinula aff. detonsa]